MLEILDEVTFLGVYSKESKYSIYTINSIYSFYSRHTKRECLE